MTWDPNAGITREMRGIREPPGCPNGKTCIPDNLQVHVIEWAHTSPTSGHLGIHNFRQILVAKNDRVCEDSSPIMRCVCHYQEFASIAVGKINAFADTE